MKIVPEFLLRHDLRLFVFVSTPTIDIEPIKRAVAGSNRSIDQIVRVQRVTNRLGTIQMSW